MIQVLFPKLIHHREECKIPYDPEREARVRKLIANSPDFKTFPRESVICWACSKTCPLNTRTDIAGWYTRPLIGYEGRHAKPDPIIVEVYCPDCFDKWGWGDTYYVEY